MAQKAARFPNGPQDLSVDIELVEPEVDDLIVNAGGMKVIACQLGQHMPGVIRIGQPINLIETDSATVSARAVLCGPY